MFNASTSQTLKALAKRGKDLGKRHENLTKVSDASKKATSLHYNVLFTGKNATNIAANGYISACSRLAVRSRDVNGTRTKNIAISFTDNIANAVTDITSIPQLQLEKSEMRKWNIAQNELIGSMATLQSLSGELAAPLTKARHTEYSRNISELSTKCLELIREWTVDPAINELEMVMKCNKARSDIWEQFYELSEKAGILKRENPQQKKTFTTPQTLAQIAAEHNNVIVTKKKDSVEADQNGQNGQEAQATPRTHLSESQSSQVKKNVDNHVYGRAKGQMSIYKNKDEKRRFGIKGKIYAFMMTISKKTKEALLRSISLEKITKLYEAKQQAADRLQQQQSQVQPNLQQQQTGHYNKEEQRTLSNLEGLVDRLATETLHATAQGQSLSEPATIVKMMERKKKKRDLNEREKEALNADEMQLKQDKNTLYSRLYFTLYHELHKMSEDEGQASKAFEYIIASLAKMVKMENLENQEGNSLDYEFYVTRADVWSYKSKLQQWKSQQSGKWHDLAVKELEGRKGFELGGY